MNVNYSINSVKFADDKNTINNKKPILQNDEKLRRKMHRTQTQET